MTSYSIPAQRKLYIYYKNFISFIKCLYLKLHEFNLAIMPDFI